ITPSAAHEAHCQCDWYVPSKTKYSPTNPFSIGSPMEASAATRKSAASFGIGVANPPYSLISNVCRRSYNMPTNKNSAPVVIPCASIWYTAPCIEMLRNAKIPSTTKPRWLTEEYATSFFKFGCTSATSAPNNTEIGQSRDPHGGPPRRPS